MLLETCAAAISGRQCAASIAQRDSRFKRAAKRSGSVVSAAYPRQVFADLPVEPRIGDIVELRRFRIDDDNTRALSPGNRNRIRDRKHLQTRADGAQKIRLVPRLPR